MCSVDFQLNQMGHVLAVVAGDKPRVKTTASFSRANGNLLAIEEIEMAPNKKTQKWVDDLFEKGKFSGFGKRSHRRELTSRVRIAGTARADETRDLHREGRYQLISTASILIPKELDKLDENVVADIGESILLYDLLHPIAIRRAEPNQRGGKNKGKFVLVAGAHRLEAIKRAGRQRIWCSILDGDDTEAKLVRLGEDLFRKTLTVLQKAEKLVAYLNLASAKVNISGQVGQKSKVGRPPGGVALAARELPVLGRSVAARRKIIDRAIKISQITPEAKRAARDARLDNNQRALLKIEEAGGRDAQLKKAAEFAAIAKALSAPLNRAAKSSVGSRVAKEAVRQTQQRQRTTTFDEMLALWKQECRDAWRHLPAVDRERLIETIRRAPLLARVNIVEFVHDVFRGRGEIRKEHLFGIAATRGFPKSAVRKTLKGLGYESKRKGPREKPKWFFLNRDQNWMRLQPVIADAELASSAGAQPNPRDTAPKRGKPFDPDYFADL
ncbi:ParB N-terminal domain-containing protein [Bradyrhizobium sp. F1.13.3]|uniref:ParB/RepB/Spo0J family partition protein n=1 Tax=Bradyrhizobium sp. F1.13.3 TaxID=3156351 RepID=UPI003392FC09